MESLAVNKSTIGRSSSEKAKKRRRAPKAPGWMRGGLSAVEALSPEAARAAAEGGRILVVPSGEQEEWPEPGLRPAFEDLCGAGAVIDALPEKLSRSPEAKLAAAVFRDARPELEERMRHCASGRWKLARGLARDVELAAELDVSDAVPILSDGAYSASSSTSASTRSG